MTTISTIRRRNRWRKRLTCLNFISLLLYIPNVVYSVVKCLFRMTSSTHTEQKKNDLEIVSSPLVRIRTSSNSNNNNNNKRTNVNDTLLGYKKEGEYRVEEGPLYWAKSNEIDLKQTLYYIHFIKNDGRKNQSQSQSQKQNQNPLKLDSLKLVTAKKPYQWVKLVYAASGRLGFTCDQLEATVFHIEAIDDQQYILKNEINNQSLIYSNDGIAKFNGSFDQDVHAIKFMLDLLPLSPRLSLSSNNVNRQIPHLHHYHHHQNICSVQILNLFKNSFLVSKPNEHVKVSTHNTDKGWDIFQLHYNQLNQCVKLIDSSGHPLGVTDSNNLLGLQSKPPNNTSTSRSSSSWSSSNGYEDASDSDKEAPDPTATCTDFQFEVQQASDDPAVNGSLLPLVIRSKRGYVTLNGRRDTVLSVSSKRTNKFDLFSIRLCIPSQSNHSIPRVRLDYLKHGIRQVIGIISIPTSFETVYNVLTDYEGFQDFLHDASESSIINRVSESKLTVRVVQCHSFLMLTIPMEMILSVNIEKEKGLIHMSLVKGFGIKSYEGTWSIKQSSEHSCIMKCDLKAATAVPAPGFLVDGLMANAMTDSFKEIRQECIKRETTT